MVDIIVICNVYGNGRIVILYGKKMWIYRDIVNHFIQILSIID